MTTSPKATPRRTGEIIGVDWGVQSLFATSDGRLLGLGLYAWLSERDVELETLTKELNRSHIPCRESKRYRRLNKRIRDHVTNEPNRLLNRLGEQDIKEIVVEELDFRHGGLTRRMNRIVSRAGRNAVKRKLKTCKTTRASPSPKSTPHTHRRNVRTADAPTRATAKPETCSAASAADTRFMPTSTPAATYVRDVLAGMDGVSSAGSKSSPRSATSTVSDAPAPTIIGTGDTSPRVRLPHGTRKRHRRSKLPNGIKNH